MKQNKTKMKMLTFITFSPRISFLTYIKSQLTVPYKEKFSTLQNFFPCQIFVI